MLWSRLRNRNLCGFKFRRQHPIGPFILDFFCFELRLAIEIDGGVHDVPSERARNVNRDAYLTDAGVEVLHLPAERVERNLTGAIRDIFDCCMRRSANIAASYVCSSAANSTPPP